MESKLDKLPDDILISIVRLMDFKDAIRTSLTCKNLQGLFAYKPNLNFDGSSKVFTDHDIDRWVKFAQSNEKLFLGSVHRVLASYKEQFMDSFRVRYPLDNAHGRDIDRWVKFALYKGVKTLELDFSDNQYNLLRIVNSSQYRLPCSVITSTLYESRFRLLKCLRLMRVTNILIQSILSTCTVLERLHVENCQMSNSLGYENFTSKSLKFLVIKGLYVIEGLYSDEFVRIKIEALNLVELELRGSYHLINISAPNLIDISAPNLLEASFGGNYSNILLQNFSHINSFSTHLLKLHLDLNMLRVYGFSNIPTLVNVEDLVLRLTNLRYYAPFYDLITKLLEACPSLHKARLETDWLKTEVDLSSDSDEDGTDWLKTEVDLSSDSDEDGTECSLDDVQEWLEDENNDGFKPTLPNLRRLEWSGAFRSHFQEEVLVALYIVKNATKIEKLVFNPRSLLKFHHSSHPSVVDEEEDISRENVRQLARVIPKRVEIIIL